MEQAFRDYLDAVDACEAAHMDVLLNDGGLVHMNASARADEARMRAWRAYEMVQERDSVKRKQAEKVIESNYKERNARNAKTLAYNQYRDACKYAIDSTND